MKSLAAAMVTLASIWLSAPVAASPESDATIVLYNRNDPESRDLAKYYAEAREIPFAQVLGLDCPADEEISRDQYLVKIEAPLRAAFSRREWWKIDRNASGQRVVVASSKRFVAIIRGVPLKIRPDGSKAPPPSAEIKPGSPIATLLKHNEASVDSELSGLFALLEEYPSVLANPYYRRFTPILQVPPSAGPLLVTRLDAPSADTVRTMIDSAIATEKTGLWGWAYLDARSITTGGYKEGDDWITEVGNLLRKRGIPVIADYSPDILPVGYPVTDAAVYYGWYTDRVRGPFADPNFRFVPGAVAAHIHSFSANTLRNPNGAWAAPLVTRGAAATVGNVYEPYLSLTANLDVLQDRLMAGFTLAEAAYASQRALSWMNIVLGDPLYRPYAEWLNPDPSATDTPWRQYRTAVLAHDGSPIDAAEDLRKLATASGNSMFLEALGHAYAAERQFDRATETLQEAARLAKDPAIRFRITLGEIEILTRSKNRAAARTAVAAALGTFRSEAQRSILDKLALDLAEK